MPLASRSPAPSPRRRPQRRRAPRRDRRPQRRRLPRWPRRWSVLQQLCAHRRARSRRLRLRPNRSRWRRRSRPLRRARRARGAGVCSAGSSARPSCTTCTRDSTAGSSAVAVVKLQPPSRLDTLRPILEARANRVDELLHIYSTTPACSLHMLAQPLGGTVYDAMPAVALADDVDVKCTFDESEWTDALFDSVGATDVVIDGPAISTLFLLDRSSVLGEFEGRLSLAQGTLDARRVVLAPSSSRRQGVACRGHEGRTGVPRRDQLR